MNSKMIQLAMKLLGCSQKELAEKLSVSPTQITKWKQGEYMSTEMDTKIRSLLNIGDLDPEVILFFGSVENAKKWNVILRYLIEGEEEMAESGFNTAPFIEEPDFVISQLVDCLTDLGYKISFKFPKEFEFIDLDSSEWSEENVEIIYENRFCKLAQQIFKSYTDIYGFYAAYISDLENQFADDFVISEVFMDMYAGLMDLAVVKADTELCSLEKFKRFKFEVGKNYRDWINMIKLGALKANIPLKAELMNLVDNSHDELGAEAESESLGFNNHRLHPDIYMNELLVGMRLIHQVLPVILDKLGIDDFEIDGEALRKF